MKDSPFFSLDFTADQTDALAALLAHPSDDFMTLVRVAGLDPQVDFRHSNLRDVDFGGADLRGFDFTGADLRGAIGSPRWDQTTLLDDADLEGSVFDLATRQIRAEAPPVPLPIGFENQHWPELIMWMDQLQANPDRYREDAEKLLYVLLKAEDTFVRRTALRYLSEYLTPNVIMELIRELVFDAEEKSLVMPAFALLQTFYPDNQLEVRRFVTGLLRGRWTVEAADFLLRNIRNDQLAFRSLVEFMSRHPTSAVRRQFIASLAEQHGAGAALVVRDPLSGDVFDFGAPISLDAVNLIVRAITRIKRDEEEQKGRRPISDTFPANTIGGIRKKVLSLLSMMSDLGMRFKLPISAAFNVKEASDRVVAAASVEAADVG